MVHITLKPFCVNGRDCFMCAGLSLLRPMYYEYPEAAEAYSFDRQVLDLVDLFALLP